MGPPDITRETADDTAAPVRPSPLGMWLPGCLYLFVLPAAGIFLTPVTLDLLSALPAVDAGAVLVVEGGVLLVIVLTSGLARAFRVAGLPHPFWSALLLAMAVAAALVQFGVGVRLYSPHTFFYWVAPLAFSLVSVAVGGIAVLAVLTYTRGRGLLWAALALAAIVALRIGWDGYALQVDERNELARERAEFDRVTADLDSQPPLSVLPDDGDWTAVSVEGFGVTYERADGAEFNAYSWEARGQDILYTGTDDEYPGPLRSGCHDGGSVCEDFEAGERTGVVFQNEYDPHYFVVRVGMGSDPESHLDLEPRSDGFVPEDLIDLIDDFRPFEQDDVERLAEEVTGGPRP